MPIKLLLLVIAMAMFGLNTYAQTGKSVKVANDQQLIEALQNPAVEYINLATGYYAYLNTFAEEGTTVVKHMPEGGNRSEQCQYFIISNSVCFIPNDTGFVSNTAEAGYDDFLCGGDPFCCPNDDTGEWSVINQPGGSTLWFISPINDQIMNFVVDQPGAYTLRYTWGPPYNSQVETQYRFYGPVTVELSAPDVCDIETLVSYAIGNEYWDSGTTTVWTLNDNPYNPGVTVPDTGNFTLTVPWCGYWKLSVTVTPTRCPPVTETIWIDFSCEPTADAGEDAYLCYDYCYYSLIGGTGLGTWSPNHAFSWVQIGGPGELVFDDEFALTTWVCVDEEEDCKYGEYEVQLQIQNGMCYDEDEVTLIFYEQPTADAGDDFIVCAEFCFTLDATPFDYCGEPGVNYWKHAWWELVEQPGNCDVDFDPLDPKAYVCIVDCDDECAYGDYKFVWYEVNVKVIYDERNGNDTLWSESVCIASDEVVVTIYEQPVADAGEDFFTCVEGLYSPYYTYMMDANSQIEYCFSMYGEWTKSCGPGDVTFIDIYDAKSLVYFWQPGKYIFNWNLWNEACEDSDDVTIILLEQPTAFGYNDELIADCDELCISLEEAAIVPYEYYGTDEGECPNHGGFAYWSFVDGPGGVTFADDTDPYTEMCVTIFGCYTVRWNEVNRIDDVECVDYFDVFVAFIETPDPFAGDDAVICDDCYTMQARSSFGDDCLESEQEEYWSFISYTPPVDPCPTDDYVVKYSPNYEFSDPTDPNAQLCVLDDCYGSHYGTYEFAWVNRTLFCEAYDVVSITFQKVPDPVALKGEFNPSNCMDTECPDCFVECLWPEDTAIPLEVCAGSCLTLYIDWDCEPCVGGPIPGYTYEWSFAGPAGTTITAEPYWYDCEAECWRGTDWVEICFGECCDIARLYLTITSPEGCVTTEEWQFYVNHGPCADIEGPEVADVNQVYTYCSCELEVPDPCLLYNWTVEHCGEIVGGQGTQCIDVLWTDYNVNDGWGRITVTVVDTCTVCCSYDEMDVKVYPSGTIGTDVLYGYVRYHNNLVPKTPLNGVEVQLWNSGIPVMSTSSFNDIEGGMGMGFYVFPNVNGMTEFDITATYAAPWYGANATDALAVELKVVDNLPGPFIFDDVVEAAMDVNNSTTITALDALWIKQRAIGMVNYFPAGDWAFAEMSASAGDSPYDIMTLNVGDANRSNIPNSMKAAPAIDLIADGVMNVVTGEEFLLPIRVAEASQFGAITLDLGFNSSALEVVDVIAPEGMVTHINNGNVSIAWSSLNPMVLSANDAVVTLRVIATGEVAASDMLFNIGLNSEFASPAATVIEPVTLKTYGISTSPAAEDYFLSTNRPNPFSTSTFIEYTLPETGKVRLSVLDMLGQEIAVLVESTQPAGSYSVEFSGTGLATGVYLYKITVDGETRDYISTQRMVISH